MGRDIIFRKVFLIERGEKMSSMVKAICNGIYGAFALFYFLLQNGVISFPGTVEYGGFTADFKKVLFVLQMILLVLGIVVTVIDYLKVNDAKGIGKAGRIMGIIAAVSNCVFILGAAKVSIFCVGNIIGAVMIGIGIKGEQER